MMCRPKLKRMAEGGDVKSGSGPGITINPFQGLLPMLINGDLGRMLGGGRSDDFSKEEKERLRAMAAARGEAVPAAMKRGGQVKRMAKGGKVRGCGAAKRGMTRGVVR
jgi:hypothetical protein